MRRYDAVLIPISFDSEHRHLTEFNIATKTSECLASGTVTILFGPDYAAMVRYLRPTGAACVLTDPALAVWPAVAPQIKNPGYRGRVLDNARRLVQAELSTEVKRARWRKALGELGSREENENALTSLDR